MRNKDDGKHFQNQKINVNVPKKIVLLDKITILIK